MGGPAAWFVQLCLGDLLASSGCYRGSQRYLQSPDAWTWPALIALLIGCTLIALAAALVSRRRFRRLPAETAATTPATGGGGGERYMALWGMVLGIGFCVATLLTVIAYLTVPRCA